MVILKSIPLFKWVNPMHILINKNGYFLVRRAKLVSVLCAIACLISACGADTQTSNLNVADTSEAKDEQRTDIDKATPWSGSASGYISEGDPASDRIELFVRLGRLLAAASVYQQRANEIQSEHNPAQEQIRSARARTAEVFSKGLINSYAEIDSLIERKADKSKQALSLQGYLDSFISERTLGELVNVDRAQRVKRNEAMQKTRDFMSRIHAVVLAFFPSRHEYLLASSALIREAGDKMAKGVSADGVVLDSDSVQEAFALIDRSVKLDPKNVSFCESQRTPIRDHKKTIDDLLNKMAQFERGIQLGVTASDIYNLAREAQIAGERFPEIDSSDCE